MHVLPAHCSMAARLGQDMPDRREFKAQHIPRENHLRILGISWQERRGSVVVSTPAYHAVDRGSNPARTRRDYYV